MNPITREESLLDGQDLTPITRKEKFIKRIYDKTQEIPEPITREEWFLKKAGEGTSPVIIEQLNATENGTYSEPGKAYSPVIVEVPAPTLITKSITANGTYSASEDNADGYSQVTVNVEGFKKKSIANTPTDIASFNDGTANPMPSLEISIEPQQDLHGYDNPWAGGAGKNKCDTHGYAGIGYNGAVGTAVTFTDSTTTVTVNKNTISYSVPSWGGVVFKTASLPSGTYCFHAEFSSTVNRKSFYVLNSNNVIKDAGNYSDIGGTLNILRTLEDGDCIAIWIGSNNAVDITITNMQVEGGSSYTSFAPYENICPISGHTEADVTVTDDLTTPTETHTLSIPFHDSSDNPITVYGGTLNVTSGELRVTHTNIASYNGETINEPWISSMDDYSAGATPTTGAQVVYPLATPQTYQLTPTQVSTLLGQNNIFADCGQILEGEYFVTL